MDNLKSLGTKLDTIQKNGNLNTIFRDGIKGPGAAYYTYNILLHMPYEELEDSYGINIKDSSSVIEIQFQKGSRCSSSLSVPGVFDADLLEIVRDRLRSFQKGEFSCRENDIALTHIEDALLWLNKIVEDRIERNVLGIYNK